MDEYSAQSMVIPPQVAPKPPPRSRNHSRASIPFMTPSHVPLPISPNMQSTTAPTSLSTHEDSSVAPIHARSRAGSTYNEPLLRPPTGPTGELYRHGSGSQASLVSNRTTASMRPKVGPYTGDPPPYDDVPEGIDELDLSARAASPSRKAVKPHIGDAKTSVWKRPKKPKK